MHNVKYYFDQLEFFKLSLRPKIYSQKQILKKGLFDLARRFQGIYEERIGCFSSQTLQDIRFRRILKTEKSEKKKSVRCNFQTIATLSKISESLIFEFFIRFENP